VECKHRHIVETDEPTGVSGENAGGNIEGNSEETKENAAEITSVLANRTSWDRTGSTWGISHQPA
jgi:hypothetical protein